MSSAVDTNVLVALLAGTVAESEAAREALAAAARLGAIAICPAVHAELRAMPGMAEGELDAFLADTRIETDWALPPEVWLLAGGAFAGYAERRRRQRGDPGPRRILADFLIGAHARVTAERLLTLDPQLYRSNFPDLELVVPAST